MSDREGWKQRALACERSNEELTAKVAELEKREAFQDRCWSEVHEALKCPGDKNLAEWAEGRTDRVAELEGEREKAREAMARKEVQVAGLEAHSRRLRGELRQAKVGDKVGHQLLDISIEDGAEKVTKITELQAQLDRANEDRTELNCLRGHLFQEYARPAYAEIEGEVGPAKFAIEVMNRLSAQLDRANGRVNDVETHLRSAVLMGADHDGSRSCCTRIAHMLEQLDEDGW